MKENKQLICDYLCQALRATRDHADLLELYYVKDREVVQVRWEGGTEEVNVNRDSGAAIIRDIMTVCR